MLQNTKYNLEVNKKLNIVFFGGSDTDGTGASDMEKTSYRALVTDWFRRTYPDAEITSVNSSIGGTGTGFAMLRCEEDVIAHSPDLVFLEYAGNDWGDTFENVLPQVETVFRKIRAARPTTDIVTLFAVYDDIARDIELGREYEARTAHAAASHWYGIPTIDMGAVLLSRTLREGGEYDRYIADTMHPNDRGHRLYSDTVTERLGVWLGEAEPCIKEHPMPRPIGKTWCGAHILAPSSIRSLSLNGFRMNDSAEGSRYGERLETDTEGASFDFTFEGCGFGFYWGSANINGDVEITIDGGKPFRVHSWDHYVRSFHRLRAAIVTRELPEGEHRVSVKALPFCPNDVSPDRTVKIDGLFIF